MKVDDYIDLFNIDSKCYSKTYDIIEYMLNDFKEEREAIFRYLEFRYLESRKCENCKYNKEQDDFMIFCDKEMCQDNSKMMWHSFTKDFCCKYWESK